MPGHVHHSILRQERERPGVGEQTVAGPEQDPHMPRTVGGRREIGKRAWASVAEVGVCYHQHNKNNKQSQQEVSRHKGATGHLLFSPWEGMGGEGAHRGTKSHTKSHHNTVPTCQRLSPACSIHVITTVQGKFQPLPLRGPEGLHLPKVHQRLFPLPSPVFGCADPTCQRLASTVELHRF